MKMPPSVLFVLILLSLASLLNLLVLLVWTPLVFVRLWGSARSPMASVIFLLEFAIGVGLLGFFIFTIISIARRRPKARAMGIAALIVVFAVAVLSKLRPTSAGQGLPTFELNANERIAGHCLDALSAVAFVTLFFRFGFGAASRRFFSPTDTAPRTGGDPASLPP